MANCWPAEAEPWQSTQSCSWTSIGRNAKLPISVAARLSAIEALEKITAAGLMGRLAQFQSTELDGGMRGIVESLAKRARKDKSWRVRLACSEALANLAISLQQPLAAVRRHLEGDDSQMKMAATRFVRLLTKTGSSMDCDALAQLANAELVETVRREYDAAAGEALQDYKMGKTLARSIARRLIGANLSEVNNEDEERQLREQEPAKSAHGKKKGRWLEMRRKGDGMQKSAAAWE